MQCLKDYLLGGGNEYLAEDENTFLWLWSGSVGEYLTDESKESYIAELVAMDDPSQEESGKRKRQRVGGRSPLMSVNNDFIKSSELINPELLKGNIERKPLLQNEDNIKFSHKDFKIVSKVKPNAEQMKNLIFAFNICRYVKSNAIVLACNNSTVGIGSGQPSRVDSCQIAINKMKKFVNPTEEIVAASDAFFPFVDGIEKLIQSGVSAVIQPSGSINDKNIIRYANDTNTILVFSKTRHFKH